MTAFVALRAALEARLSSMGGGYQIAWEGTAFTPTTPESIQIHPDSGINSVGIGLDQHGLSVIWLRPTLLPADSEAEGIGANARTRIRGVFQVSVFAPSSTGTGLAMGAAEAISTHFPRGTRLTSGSIDVLLGPTSIAPVIAEPDWLHVPVSVSFIASLP